MDDPFTRSLQAEKAFWKGLTEFGHFSRQAWESQLARDDLSFEFFEGKVVCEVGCGPFGMIYHAPGGRRIGIDPLIDYYRELGLLDTQRTAGMTLINSGGESINDLGDSIADIVICYNVLDHVRRPQCVLKEIRRILRPEGTLYLNCHVISRLLIPCRSALRHLDAAHPHHFSAAQLRRLVRDGGFAIGREKVYRMRPSVRSIKAVAGRIAMFHYAALATAENADDSPENAATTNGTSPVKKV